MAYKIGSIEFKSKQQSENFTRDIINEIGINDSITKDHPRFSFFCDLIENHHKKDEKIGCGISSFIIDRNYSSNGFEVSIRRLDGSIESFSWKNCARIEHKTNDELLDVAMRSSIDNQIKEFKASNEEMCSNPECRKKEKCEVDHKTPTFYELTNLFLKGTTYMIPTTFDKNSNNQRIFKESDKEFEEEWQKFHKEYATLQYLCIPCHKIKTKNDLKIIKDLKKTK